MIYIVRESNRVVTDYYFDIFKKALNHLGIKVAVVNDFKPSSWNKRKDYVVVGSIVKAYKLKIKGFKNIIMWFQGIVPEESYLKNNSHVKKAILGFLESQALKNSLFSVFVSEEMRLHYERKYKISIEANEYYTMPCYNTELCDKSFFNKYKYNHNNTFVYAGGLSVWQGFDKIVAVYKKIEELRIPNTKLLVLTKEKENARVILEKHKVNNFEISFVNPESLNDSLADVKFGFIIRDGNIVNRVSTPTKISTYIANGIIPIYSENLVDFESNTKNVKFKLSVDSPCFFQELKDFMINKIDNNEVYLEFKSLYQTYYNTDLHIKNLSAKINEIIR